MSKTKHPYCYQPSLKPPSFLSWNTITPLKGTLVFILNPSVWRSVFIVLSVLNYKLVYFVSALPSVVSNHIRLHFLLDLNALVIFWFLDTFWTFAFPISICNQTATVIVATCICLKYLHLLSYFRDLLIYPLP